MNLFGYSKEGPTQFFLFLFQLCDIVLRVGVTTLSAHRVVLAATSPYFHAMFNGKTIHLYLIIMEYGWGL